MIRRKFGSECAVIWWVKSNVGILVDVSDEDHCGSDRIPSTHS